MAEWGFVAENSVVNRYVRSIHDVAASTDSEREVGRQLSLVKECVIRISSYKKLLKRASFLPEQAEALVTFLKKNLELSLEVCNFLDLLLKNNRINLIINICEAYSAYLDKLDGKKLFYLTVAAEPTKTQMNALIGDLKSVFGRKIECVTKVDPSLKDGFKLQYQSKVLDYSLKSRLKRLRNAIRRENYEN